MSIWKVIDKIKSVVLYDADNEFYAKVFPESIELKDLIRIRKMRSDDLSDVLAVESKNYRFPWSEAIFTDCLNSWSYACWVCTETEKVVGYGIVSMAAGEAHIMNISIDPRLQNQGVGGKLLDHLIEYAGKKSEKIFLEVRPDNKHAISLYEKKGFSQIGVRKGYYPSANGGREDAIVLALEIIKLPK